MFACVQVVTDDTKSVGCSQTCISPGQGALPMFLAVLHFPKVFLQQAESRAETKK